MDKKVRGLIRSFDQADSILAISAYPEKGIKYSGKVCAVGGFTKNITQALKYHFKEIDESIKKIIVLTVIIDKEEVYTEEGVLVWRVFKRNSPPSYFKLWQAIGHFNKVQDILVGFEFASFGDTKTTVLFPLILFWLRLLGKGTILALHQVVLDLNGLAGHLGWKNNDLRVKLLTPFLKGFYWLLVLLSQRVVVLEEVCRQRLIKMIGMEDKIIFIPHGVDRTQKLLVPQNAQKKLGVSENEFILLYFGYLTWYKGVDFLVKTFVENKIEVGGKPVRLVIAGGESPTQKTKAHYQKFIKKIYSLAKKSTQVIITGYVEEKDISLYFSAADLVIFPYRTFMSSSGPLSLACSFKKPFIMSSRLAKYFLSPDFCLTLDEVRLKKEDLLFPLKQRSLIDKIRLAFQKEKLTKLTKFSCRLSEKRNFSVLAPAYAQLLTENQTNHTSSSLWLKLRYALSLLF